MALAIVALVAGFLALWGIARSRRAVTSRLVDLSAQTVAGAAEMVLATGQHPASLRDMVTSPGGTTIAGLEALEAKGARVPDQGKLKALDDAPGSYVKAR